MYTNSSLRQRKIVDLCVKDILRFSFLASIPFLLVIILVWGSQVGLAYGAGVFVSMINLVLLRYQLEFIVSKGRSGAVVGMTVFGYLVRFLGMGCFLYFMGKLGIAHLLAGGFGLLAVRLGILIYGVRGKFEDAEVF